MQKRVAVVAIIVEEADSVEALNTLLHEFRAVIIGRMGIPIREKGINVISVVVCADNNTISALSGKIGRIKGVGAKVTYSNATFDE